MISEDFSWYQQYVPGVFFFLGTGTNIPLHNSHFDFDEEILLQGIQHIFKLSKCIKEHIVLFYCGFELMINAIKTRSSLPGFEIECPFPSGQYKCSPGKSVTSLS